MRKYSRLIIIGMCVVAMQIVTMSISSILRIASFGDFYYAFAYVLMLLIFVFANIFIIGKFIMTISEETNYEATDSVQKVNSAGGEYGDAIRDSKNRLPRCAD